MIIFALSTHNMIGLGAVGLVWIVFSLGVSIVVPRYRQNFPKNVGGFLAVCALFFVAMVFAVFYFGKESKDGEAATPETPALTQAATTETTATSGGSADLAAGKAAFVKGSCGGCHTLKAANTNGTVGPNLDALKPSEAIVEHQVTNGGGAMPAYKGTFSAAEIKAVATYVSQVAGTS